MATLPKTNMDIQNDGLEKVTPFKKCNCWYVLDFWGVYDSQKGVPQADRYKMEL